jgi:hypothetical protein
MPTQRFCRSLELNFFRNLHSADEDFYILLDLLRKTINKDYQIHVDTLTVYLLTMIGFQHSGHLVNVKEKSLSIYVEGFCGKIYDDLAFVNLKIMLIFYRKR